MAHVVDDRRRREQVARCGSSQISCLSTGLGVRAACRPAFRTCLGAGRDLQIEPLEDRRLLALATIDTFGMTDDFNDGMTSLRAASIDTNLTAGADATEFISLASVKPATITLTQAELTNTDDKSIIGPNASVVTEQRFFTLDGGGTYHMSPRYISNYNDTKLYLTTIDPDGNQEIHCFNRNTGAITTTLVNTYGLIGDDHGPPIIHQRSSDNRLITLFAENLLGILRGRISENPDDSTAWGPEFRINPVPSLLGYGYTQLHELNGILYLVYQGYYDNQPNQRQWGIATSSDGGMNWTQIAMLHPVETAGWGNRPYFNTFSNGTKIGFVTSTGNPPEGNDQLIVYFEFDGTNWTNAAGMNIGVAPFGIQQIDTVYDGRAGTNKAWYSSGIFDSLGKPHLLFTVYDGGNLTNQDLYEGIWNGSSWSSAKIMDEGPGIKPVYSGGAAFDPLSEGLRFVTAKSENGIYEMQQWLKTDNMWAKEYDITIGSAFHHFRPFYAKGSPANATGRWMFQSPTKYVNYNNWAGAIETFPFLRASGPADYNLDHGVDAADYVMWRKLLGTSVTPPFSGADGDGDSSVDPDDYDVWCWNFGETLPGTVGGVAEASSGGMQGARADALNATTIPAPNEKVVAAAQAASFAALETRLPRHVSTSRSRGMPRQYQVTESGNNDLLLLLAIDSIQRSSGKDSFVADDSENAKRRVDDDDRGEEVAHSITDARSRMRMMARRSVN
jgi:hypothetical protein